MLKINVRTNIFIYISLYVITELSPALKPQHTPANALFEVLLFVFYIGTDALVQFQMNREVSITKEKNNCTETIFLVFVGVT